MMLSILVPTVGRGNLPRLLASVKPQLEPLDEVIVLGDEFYESDESAPETWRECVRKQVESLGSQFYYIPAATDHHCWGHCQLNTGMRIARGEFLIFNDDDDIFTPRALSYIRSGIDMDPFRPALFRYECPNNTGIVWQDRVIKLTNLSGQGFVVPNIPEKLGRWTCAYAGDYDFVVSTLAHYDRVEWNSDIVARGRPCAEEQVWAYPVKHARDVELLRQLRNKCVGTFVNYNEAITEKQQWLWWRSEPDVYPWLYRSLVNDDLLGFGMLARKDEALWLTLGVVPEHRGQGWGTIITTHQRLQGAGEPVYSKILLSNLAALHAHVPAYWHEVQRNDSTLILKAL